MTTTTYIDFIQSSLAPFAFQPTLDDRVYSAQIKWNLFGRRYYLELTGLDGEPIVNKALIGSPIGIQLESVSWEFGRVAAVTSVPHKYTLGSTLELTVSGCVPDSYNGIVEALVTGPLSFSYPVIANPGDTSEVGKVDYNINLVAGYFMTSVLVFRDASQQFEVINP